MDIFILRHCKTLNNSNNSWSGCKSDIDLSEEGIIRHKELLKELSCIDFDIIYTSPMKRCLITATELAKLTNAKLIIDKRLIERDFGSLEGKPCNDNDKIKLADLELNTDLNHGVEKLQSIYLNRVKPFFNELFNSNYKKVLVVTHSWIVRLARYLFDNEKTKSLISITPKNGEYYKYSVNDNNIISRNFNSITINNNLLTKKSLYTSKFNDEINWMINIPDEIKTYIPKIYSYHISPKNKDNDLSYITMEYIKQQSFDQFYLKNQLDKNSIEGFFNQINIFINKASKYSIDIEPDKIEEYQIDIYYQKTIDRWNLIKDDQKFNSFYNNPITINNKVYKPVKYYLDNLLCKLNEYKVIDSSRKFCIIHGDLCFNNIIFDNNHMYLVDPRGSFGKQWIYGDQLYELAKISHSISGYDSIINNYYQLTYQNNNISYQFTNSINKQLFLVHFEKLIDKDNLTKIYLIESLLFLSMIPLHGENYSHQIMMLSLALEKLNKFIN